VCPLRNQLVAAYLPGTHVGDDTFPSNELCFATARKESTVVVTWNTCHKDKVRLVKGKPLSHGKAWPSRSLYRAGP
jgi:hypothetical protein